MGRNIDGAANKQEAGRSNGGRDVQSYPEPDDIMVIGPVERGACEYIAELCEGLLLVDGVSRLPKVGMQLMLLHALCLDYAARAHRAGINAAA